MTSRAEGTSRYAKAYVKASKKDKGRVLDAVVEVTGWSRDNARRRLVAADVALCGAVGGEAGGDQLAGRVVSRGVSIRLGPAVAGRWQPAGTRLASVRLGGEGRGSGLVSAARLLQRPPSASTSHDGSGSLIGTSAAIRQPSDRVANSGTRPLASTSTPAPSLRDLNATVRPASSGATSQTSQPGVAWPGRSGRLAAASISRPYSGPDDRVDAGGGCHDTATGLPASR